MSKNANKFLDRIIYFGLGFLSIYTIFTTLVWAFTGNEPPATMTEYAYKFWGFELVMTAIITLFKIVWKQKGNDNYE